MFENPTIEESDCFHGKTWIWTYGRNEMFKVSWQHWIDIQIVMQRFNFKRRFLRISNFTKWFIWNSLQDDIELLFYTNDDLVKGLMVWVSALQNNGFVWGLFLLENFILSGYEILKSLDHSCWLFLPWDFSLEQSLMFQISFQSDCQWLTLEFWVAKKLWGFLNWNRGRTDCFVG